jgi:hypothetical protein
LKLKRLPARPARGRRFVLPEEIVWLTATDGSVRLLDLRGNFFALDAVGARLLRALLSGGLDEAVRCLDPDARLPHAEVVKEASAFIDQLQQQLLLAESTPAERKQEFRRHGRALLHRLLKRVALWRFVSAGTPPRLACRLFPLIKLSLAVTSWESSVELCAAITRGGKRPRQPWSDPPLTAIELDRVIRRFAAHRLWRAECKERALLFWTLAHRFGLAADLVVGVRLYPFGGHCWCECGGEIMTDEVDRCVMYQPVRRYRLGSTGELVRDTLCS